MASGQSEPLLQEETSSLQPPFDKKICIIGSGASGITAIKEALDAGFRDITCYEKGSWVGGLWKYHDSDEDGIASVMKSTIINSSKEMSAYSDFPPPPELPNYCHNSLMIKYLESYADRHDVKRFVKFHHEVINIDKSDDHSTTGRWVVEVNDKTSSKSGIPSKETFDAVLVATGHHVKPLIPEFKGQEKFKGKIIHTHSYKHPIGFQDQRILVIGIGNSAGDAAVELSSIGSQVYLSTRSGVWMLWRVGPEGDPFDSTYLRRFWDWLFQLSPLSLTNSLAESMLNSRFDHEKYGLKPKHRIMGQHPMVNDALPNRILSGTVLIKGDIQEFTENGVIFRGESEETAIDSVILGTGYEVCFPFLKNDILFNSDQNRSKNQVNLYKYMFNPNLEPKPETLSFIGLIQSVGPAIPVSEMQCRWVFHLLSGKSKLPSKELMVKDILKKRLEMSRRYFAGPRHTMQIDWIPFLDELSEQFGAKPVVWKKFFTDPVLWWELIFGPCYPYQWRLDGPGKWDGARNAILEGKERIAAALKTRRTFDQDSDVEKSKYSSAKSKICHYNSYKSKTNDLLNQTQQRSNNSSSSNSCSISQSIFSMIFFVLSWFPNLLKILHSVLIGSSSSKSASPVKRLLFTSSFCLISFLMLSSYMKSNTTPFNLTSLTENSFLSYFFNRK